VPESRKRLLKNKSCLESVSEDVFVKRRIVEFFRIFALVYWKNEIPLRAAGVSYFVFFSLVPLLTTFAAVVLLLPVLRGEAEQIFLYLTHWLLPDAIQDVQTHIRALAEHATVVSIASLGLTLWLLVKIIFFLEKTQNKIWGFDSPKSPLRLMRKAAFVFTFLIAVVSIGVYVSGNKLESALVEITSTWLFFLGFNMILPAQRRSLASALPGSLVGGLAWYGTKWAFTSYIVLFAKPDKFYAILGILPLVFLWLHFSVVILLLSACFNVSLEKLFATEAGGRT